MGCKGSKLDEQEAVALCRGRADLLAAAARHRYALADAHDALADSLASAAAALHRLMTQPRVALPAEGKAAAGAGAGAGAGDARPAPANASPPHSSSHINFAPSSSDSDSGSVSSSPPHRRVDQLPHHHPLPFPHYGGYAGYGGYPPPEPLYDGYPPPQGALRLFYARSRPPPASVAVEQRAPASARVYYGSVEAAERGYTPQYYTYGGGEPAAATAAPPPPPSPPRASSWDFFNVFGDYDVYDNYCYDAGHTTAPASAAYTPSRSSREVREEEGIPDLEEDDAVVKQVAGEYSSAPGSGARSRRSSLGGVSSSIAEVDEEGTCVVDKEVVGGGCVARQQATAQRNVAASAQASRRAVDGADVAGEIKAQFVRAADAVRALSPALEVGRRRYHHRSSVYHVSSRVVSAIALPHSDLGGIALLDIGDVGGEKVSGGRTLSLTLQKLYIWEKKLYNEVKAEEKMRLLLAKNAKRLKFLDQKGAETHKIDTTRNMVRKLSTKLRISVRVIAKVSKKINRVRDEELWPQINALIQGFVRMWQDKLDCYQIQCQVMSEAKNLDSVVPDGSSRDLALELELELMKWIVNFSSWVNEQRSFVKALNGWLSLCLNYKAEETVDGVPPYSPGRVGAPLVFVICNSWSQAMDRFSEKEVVTCMQALVSSVRKLSEKQNVEQMEQNIAARERERWNKILERKTVEINKEADMLNKKLALVPGQHRWLPSAQTYQEHLLDTSSLQTSLQRVIQALETFASNSLQAFQQTLRHAEEERSSRENAKVS